MRYIFVDPSGSFSEGKGHTGIASCDEDFSNLKTVSIAANKYSSRHMYWDAILAAILDEHCTHDDIVIMESFMIRTQGFLVGKMPETIQLIGMLSWEFENYGLNYCTQTPTQAKARFKDKDLPRYIPNLEYRDNGRYYLNGKQINDHIRDALKHLLYYMKYRK